MLYQIHNTATGDTLGAYDARSHKGAFRRLARDEARWIDRDELAIACAERVYVYHNGHWRIWRTIRCGI